MKLIVDVPHEIICKRYIGANDQIWMAHAIKNGIPYNSDVNDVLEDIKLDIIGKYMSVEGKMGKVPADILKIIDAHKREDKE